MVPMWQDSGQRGGGARGRWRLVTGKVGSTVRWHCLRGSEGVKREGKQRAEGIAEEPFSHALRDHQFGDKQWCAFIFFFFGSRE